MSWQALSKLSNSRRVVVSSLLAVGLLLPVLASLATTSSTGPVANAGAPQLVAVGTTVRLDGSRSTNAAGTPLTYLWSFVSLPDASTASFSDSTAVNPTFAADQAGAYIVQLAVSDGVSVSTSQVVISTQATPPVPNAGPNQVVAASAVVHLNGSASSDADGDPLNLQWSLVSLPAGSQASISDPAAVAPTFVADLAGDYVAQLTVSDTHGNSSSASVTISTQEVPPLANAGLAQLVASGATVQLDGSASSDACSDPLSYSWSLLAKPAGSAAALSSAQIVNPTFVADVAGAYVAQLAVSDNHGNVSLATVEVVTDAIPPLANAGAARSVAPGTNVQLNGSQSSDAGGAPLTYGWSLLVKPAGSAATLQNSSSASASFVADKAGQYLAQLVVSNGVNASAPSTVLITAAASGPNLVLSPTTLNFGSQPVGTTSSPFQVTVSNTGNASIGISLFMAGLNSGEFAITSARAFSVAPDRAAIINLVFTPKSPGARSALLIVNDDTGVSSRYIDLAGTGGTATPAVQLSPNSIVFPDQTVGSSSALQSLTITNSGNANLQITSLAITASDFAFPASFTPPNFASPINVAAGGTTTVPLLFKPSATGLRTATLLITDNAGDSPQPVPLSGNGTPAPPPANTAPPGISVSPAALDFQNQTVGVPSAPLQVTVTNGNSFSVGISPSMAGLNSREFAIMSSRAFSIAPGASANISMVFTPQAGGPRSALLIVNDDSGDPTHYVTLAGTGGTSAPAVQFTPLALSFPDQTVGATSTPQSVTVTNTGNATLQITGVALGGTNSGDFGFPVTFPAPSVPISLAPNASTTIPVLFKPNATGLRSATLQIADNASGSPHSATLSGNCIAAQPPPASTTPPGISVGPASLSFPSQMVGTTSSPLQVTVSNGTAASVEFSPSMAGLNSADFAITSPRIFTLPAGGSATISMAFTPQAAGSRSAVLIVNNNNGTPSSFITLAGAGIAATSAIQLTPLTLAFADQAVGTISSSQSLTISNTGSAALQITALAFTGTNAADFSFPFTVTLPHCSAQRRR